MTTRSFKDWGGLAVKGLIQVGAPSMLKGLLVELLNQPAIYKGRQHKINVKLVVELVENNESLWLLFDQNRISQIRRIATQLGSIDWITPEWVIDAIRNDHSALASLFLGWRKSRTWLGKQISEIVSQLQ